MWSGVTTLRVCWVCWRVSRAGCGASSSTGTRGSRSGTPRSWLETGRRQWQHRAAESSGDCCCQGPMISEHFTPTNMGPWKAISRGKNYKVTGHSKKKVVPSVTGISPFSYLDLVPRAYSLNIQKFLNNTWMTRHRFYYMNKKGSEHQVSRLFFTTNGVQIECYF